MNQVPGDSETTPLPADFICPACGYDLSGARVERCSECGYRITDCDIENLNRRRFYLDLIPIGGLGRLIVILAIVVWSMIEDLEYTAMPLLVVAILFGPTVIAGAIFALRAPPAQRRLYWTAWNRFIAFGHAGTIGYAAFLAIDYWWMEQYISPHEEALAVVLTTAPMIAFRLTYRRLWRREARRAGLNKTIVQSGPGLWLIFLSLIATWLLAILSPIMLLASYLV